MDDVVAIITQSNTILINVLRVLIVLCGVEIVRLFMALYSRFRKDKK